MTSTENKSNIQDLKSLYESVKNVFLTSDFPDSKVGTGTELNTGLNTESKSLAKCRDVLQRYSGTDWLNYTEFTNNVYNRVRLIDMSNEEFEFILICWDKDQKSPIHDHPENGCLVKVLQGELQEELYALTNGSYKKVGVRSNKDGDISYMEKNVVIHRICNANGNETEGCRTVSLHIYSPPKFKYTIVPEKELV